MSLVGLSILFPAVVAEKMLEDIMNFYCKDIYNP